MKIKRRIYAKTGGENRTQKQFGDSANINNIMDRHLKGGPLQGPGRNTGATMQFGHLTGESYHEMLIKVQKAQGTFAALPSKIRKRFANNPENLFSFLEDTDNLEEAIELGLVNKQSVDPQVIEQMNLVREAEAADLAAFEEFKKQRKANIMPNRSDEEANPRK